MIGPLHVFQLVESGSTVQPAMAAAASDLESKATDAFVDDDLELTTE